MAMADYPEPVTMVEYLLNILHSGDDGDEGDEVGEKGSLQFSKAENKGINLALNSIYGKEEMVTKYGNPLHLSKKEAHTMEVIATGYAVKVSVNVGETVAALPGLIRETELLRIHESLTILTQVYSNDTRISSDIQSMLKVLTPLTVDTSTVTYLGPPKDVRKHSFRVIFSLCQ
jgi:hypothetical protein